MGSTVTCQKAAAAFRSPAGMPIYVLFESTYTKNVLPHVPSWECCCVGDIEEALKRIFGYAADCEGGMLQTRRGLTTPEAYIAGWLRCLAAPAAMPDRAVSLSGGASRLDTIRPDRIADAAALLASHGLAEASRTLQEGSKAELRLHRDAEAVAALCGAGLAASYRLIDVTRPPNGPGCAPGLDYAPARSRQTSPAPPALLKLDGDNLLVQAEDGAWRLAGWAYDLIRRHVGGAWKGELAAPGQYRTAIPALRRAAQAAPPVPARTHALVHGVEGMDKPTLRAWADIAGQHEAAATPDGWRLAATPALVSSLVHTLDRKHVSWLVPSLDAPPQPRRDEPALAPQRQWTFPTGATGDATGPT